MVLYLERYPHHLIHPLTIDASHRQEYLWHPLAQQQKVSTRKIVLMIYTIINQGGCGHSLNQEEAAATVDDAPLDLPIRHLLLLLSIDQNPILQGGEDQLHQQDISTTSSTRQLRHQSR